MRHKATAEADPRHAADNVEPFVASHVRSVGERLRNAREDLGLELRQVSEILRIRYAHLRALEEDHYSELPGQTYAIGFVRSYADYLGLDSRDLVERFKEEVSGVARSTQLVFPTPKPEGKIPGGALVLISLLLVALAYGGWYAFNEYGEELNSLIVREAPPLSPETADAPPASSPTADGATEPSATEPSATEPSATSGPAPTVADGQEESPQAELAQSQHAPAVEAPTAMPQVPAQPSTPPEASAPESTLSSPGPQQPAAPAVESTRPNAESATALRTSDLPAAAGPTSGDPADETATGQNAPAVRTAPLEEPASEAQIVRPTVETARSPAARSAAGPESAPQAAAVPESESASEVTAPSAPVLSILPTDPQSSQIPARRSALPGAAAEETVNDVAPQAAPEPAPQTTVAREEEIPVPPIPSAQGGDDQARAARVFGTANTNARIVLRATADSWVQVRNARSDLLFTQVLRAGDSYNVPNEPGLTLLTGNAGGLQVLLDGQALPPLGPSGAVRRDIQLDPASLTEGAQ